MSKELCDAFMLLVGTGGTGKLHVDWRNRFWRMAYDISKCLANPQVSEAETAQKYYGFMERFADLVAEAFNMGLLDKKPKIKRIVFWYQNQTKISGLPLRGSVNNPAYYFCRYFSAHSVPFNQRHGGDYPWWPSVEMVSQNSIDRVSMLRLHDMCMFMHSNQSPLPA